MEELKEKAGDPSAEDASPVRGARRFALPKLSKRTLIVGAAALLAIIIAATVGIILRSGAQKKAAAELVVRQKAERLAKERDEAAARGLELKRAHREIMEGSLVAPAEPAMPVATAALSEGETAAAAGVPLSSSVRSASATESLPTARSAASTEVIRAAPVAPAAAPTRSGSVVPSPASGVSPRRADAAVTSPEAAGGCTLTGQGADDYGKALAKCLEEYNRIEGRIPSARK